MTVVYIMLTSLSGYKLRIDNHVLLSDSRTFEVSWPYRGCGNAYRAQYLCGIALTYFPASLFCLKSAFNAC